MLFRDHLSLRAKRVTWILSVFVLIYGVVQVVRIEYFSEFPIPVTSLVQHGTTIIAIRLPKESDTPQEEILISHYERNNGIPRYVATRRLVPMSRRRDETAFRVTDTHDLRDDEWMTLRDLQHAWCASSSNQELPQPGRTGYEIGVRCPNELSLFYSRGVYIFEKDIPDIIQEIIYLTSDDSVQ